MDLDVGGRAVMAAVLSSLLVATAACSTSGSASGAGPTTPAATGTPTGPHSTQPSADHKPSPTKATGSPGPAPATEFNPPGDIPDNQVFVPYTPPNKLVTIKVPEGWGRTRDVQTVTFTDKLNSVSLVVVPTSKAPTVASAKAQEVPPLRHSVPKFSLTGVTTVHRNAGKAVLITYQQDSAPDPVTAKVVRDAVERYEFWKNGQESVLTLSGPTNADNVDPWRIVSDSLTWR